MIAVDKLKQIRFIGSRATTQEVGVTLSNKLKRLIIMFL